MKFRRRTAIVLLCMLPGCARREPKEALLQAFSDQSGDQIFLRDSQPDYLEFDARSTASVFSKLMRSGRYRIPPPHSSLLCPGVPGEGIHGYLLTGPKVDTTMGDGAYVSLFMDCIRGAHTCANSEQPCFTTSSDVLRMSTTYLLIKKNGNWQVVKPISGGVAVPM